MVKIRRVILFSLIMVLLSFYSNEFAQNRKGQIFYSQDDGLYWAAIKTDYFREFVARQCSMNWCWAACTQMVLNYQGVNVTQEEIVERVFGAQVDRPGNVNDIVKGASGWYVKGRRIYAGYDHPLSAQKMINDLVNKYPLIVGLSIPNQEIGHAYVLTGISFLKYGDNIVPQGVILRDPWPDNASRTTLTWSDFSNRVHTIVHIYPN